MKKTPAVAERVTVLERKSPQSIEIAGKIVRPNTIEHMEVPIARLPTGSWQAIPITVLNGKRPGKRLWLTAAIHGDEVNGVEIIREVLENVSTEQLHGTILAVPIVNTFGFDHGVRYLPDGRDLNRSFPGSQRGSLASRVAHMIMHEVISKCQYGIDLHTGTSHRRNLPQIRGDLKNKETGRLARVFGAPVIMHARVRDKSLREAATRMGVHTLLYEGGESNRFNSDAIKLGVTGVLRVMHHLKMLPGHKKTSREKYFLTASSRWIRARRSGIFRLNCELGQHLRKGEVMGSLVNTFGNEKTAVKAPFSGVVIGLLQNPVVHQGDAILHLARGIYKNT